MFSNCSFSMRDAASASGTSSHVAYTRHPDLPSIASNISSAAGSNVFKLTPEEIAATSQKYDIRELSARQPEPHHMDKILMKLWRPGQEYCLVKWDTGEMSVVHRDLIPVEIHDDYRNRHRQNRYHSWSDLPRFDSTTQLNSSKPFMLSKL